MPGGDGSGPGGMGPMTGRAAGYCAGYSVPGYMNPAGGRGYGFGRGRGFGRGFGMGFRGGRAWGGYAAVPPYTPAVPVPYGAAPNAQQEADALKGQSEYLESALKEIKKRLAELEADSKKK